MALLHSDGDFDYRVVVELRRLGHDVLTALEAGRANQGIPDADVLAFTISQGRAVVTYNRRHFIRLHQLVRPHCGIIVCTDDPNITARALRIHQAIASRPTLDNQLLRINRPSSP
jgi:Domain of unknown function (DUF5615)